MYFDMGFETLDLTFGRILSYDEGDWAQRVTRAPQGQNLEVIVQNIEMIAKLIYCSPKV